MGKQDACMDPFLTWSRSLPQAGDAAIHDTFSLGTMRPGELKVRGDKGRVTLAFRESVLTIGSTLQPTPEGNLMNSIIYIVGAVVIIVFLLGFLGLR